MTKKPTMDLHLTPINETEIETPTHTHTPHHRRRLPPPLIAAAYKECMKNHAATIGGHAVDGCGEYMSPAAVDAALTCAACGCHRNFHRREPTLTPPFLDFRRPLPVCRKRFRTKFRQDQKEKMQSFSEKVGWKIQKSDEAAAAELCREVGVSKGVLKVWMHNNKNTFSKREIINGGDQIKGGNGSQFQNEKDYFHDSNNGSNSFST